MPRSIIGVPTDGLRGFLRAETAAAARKAPRRRLLYEIAQASALLEVAAGHRLEVREAYLAGAYNAASSLSLRAAIATAWGA